MSKNAREKSTVKGKAKKNDSAIFIATLFTDSDEKLLVHLDELVSGLNATYSWLKANEKGSDGYSKVVEAKGARDKLLMQNKSNVSEVLLVPYTNLFAQSDMYDDVAEASKAEFENVWKVIESLSALVIYPHIMAKLVEYGKFKDEKTKKKLQNNLLFTFALRNILSKVAFRTVVSKAVFDVLRDTVKPKIKTKIKTKAPKGIKGINEPDYSWKKHDTTLPWAQMVAFVGFNRLMSPNNKTGVSISSDIDFNLILDPEFVQFKGDGSIEKLNEIVNKAMEKRLGDDFDEARLTLEVEDFTTDDLKSIEDLMSKNEASRNFYASMKHNHILIAGSKTTYKKFKTLLDEVTSEKAFLVAKKTHNQYLKDSAKGSILAIRNLDKLTKVLKACKKFIKFGNLDNATRAYFKEKVAGFPKDGSNKEQNEWLVGSMGFYAVLRDKKLVKSLAGKDGVKEALEDVSKLFPSIDKNDHAELLQRVAKILKGISARSYSPRLGPLDFQQIGCELAKDTAWRFNIKYCGCRLSDYMDAVPLKAYKEWNKSDGATRTYESAREVAVAINKLSLTLQTAIYLAATHRLQPVKGQKVAKAAKHATIDTLYATITKESFIEIVVLNVESISGKNKSGIDIRDAILELSAFLSKKQGTSDHSTQALMLRVISSGTKVVAGIGALASKYEEFMLYLRKSYLPKYGLLQPIFDVVYKGLGVKITVDLAKDGFDFFEAIFNLAFSTSESLVPIKKTKKK